MNNKTHFSALEIQMHVKKVSGRTDENQRKTNMQPSTSIKGRQQSNRFEYIVQC